MAIRTERPIILGIVGDSASGKTTLTEGVAKILGAERCTVIAMDDYHIYDRQQRLDHGISAVDPRGNYLDILNQHLHLLRQGQPILKPSYNHRDGRFGRSVYVQPRDFVIAEGLLGYANREMRNCFDVKIYLEPDEDLRIRWKVYRDTTQRGYSRDEVLQSLERRRQDSPAFVHPQRRFADIVIQSSKPAGADMAETRLDMRHILRSTLPHPDFEAVVQEVGEDGLTLRLARDDDGKPVDMLEIAGAISEERAVQIEDTLWRLIPEARHLRDQVGRIDAAEGSGVSHPLALSQLIVAFHMVKAAMGEMAV
ncbi:MAG: phosphoribulokinase [Pseudomonadota bacterium]|nr:phosphoribulokinase [Pseudomonadota bacterium]